MEGHFREERIHLLQFEAARRTLPPGKDFGTHFRDTYDALHDEVKPEQVVAARTAYGASSRKGGGGVSHEGSAGLFGIVSILVEMYSQEDRSLSGERPGNLAGASRVAGAGVKSAIIGMLALVTGALVATAVLSLMGVRPPK
jgi:hypothetical protein